MADAKRILLVDDEPDIIKTVQVRLEKNGYAVITAIDGQDALAKARSENPDLIILDLMLPKLNGYQVCRMLKFDEQYKKIPIIIFTARTQDQDKQTSQEVGADAYISKPFESSVLLEKIETLLNIKK